MQAVVFGSKPEDHAMLSHFVAAGVNGDSVKTVIEAGVSWPQLIQFLFRYGSVFANAAAETVAAFKAGTFGVAFIQTLLTTYGPQIEQGIRDLIKILGGAYPTT